MTSALHNCGNYKEAHSSSRPYINCKILGRGTWDEMVKRDLKEWNIAKELAMDRSAWRLAINVPEP
jgi:hypothetical protein